MFVSNSIDINVREFVKFDVLSKPLIAVAEIRKRTSPTKLLIRTSIRFSSSEYPTTIYFPIKVARNPTFSIYNRNICWRPS